MDSPARNGVVVIGSASADLTVFAPRLPSPGETIIGDDFSMVLGGKGANQAIASARAGADVQFVGCVGSDLFREIITAGLSDAGVGLRHLRTVPGPSGVAHIRVDASAQNDIVVVPLANSQLSAAHIDAALDDLAPTCSVLLTQLETPPDLTAHIVRSARARDLTVILDPAPAAPLPDDVWRYVDIVTPNETEAALLTGFAVTDTTSADKAARWFQDRGVASPIITLAGAGAVLATDRGSEVIPAFTVTPVDTTAAGDAFAGYLGAALASGSDLACAIRHASAAGALTVTKRGASSSLPLRGEVDAFVDRQ